MQITNDSIDGKHYGRWQKKQLHQLVHALAYENNQLKQMLQNGLAAYNHLKLITEWEA